MSDSLEVEIHLLPAHPQQGDSVAVEVLLDGEASGPMDYATQGRSEEWKQNMLRSQAIRRARLTYNPKNKEHRIEVRALTPGVVIDQIFVFPATHH